MIPAPTGLATQRMNVRFGATFVANVLRAALSFLGGLIVAHGLGASGYGDFAFLLGSFAAVSQLFDMGTSSAFYTFISNKPRQAVFFLVYFSWLLFQFVGTVVAVAVLLPAGVVNQLWVGKGTGIVLLSFAASFLITQGWGTVVQLGEAVRETLLVQVFGVAQACVHLLFIYLALKLSWLTVQSVMWMLVGEHCVLVVAVGPRLFRKHLTAPAAPPDRSVETAAVLSEFVAYCRPLAVYAWVGFLYAFADRWLLQRFGGSEQQGFFAVGQQFANVCLIGATSMLKVFWKEIAEARQRRDYERVRRLYVLVSRRLFCSSAWASCLLIPYSREILGWTVGPGYDAASVTLGIMFLYPIHQSLGQIQGTYFYATGQTAEYVRIGLISMAVSIPLAYVLLAPPSDGLGGLGLGSLGLALKMVLLQFLQVAVQAFLIARKNGIEHDCWLQMRVLLCAFGLGWFSRGIVSLVFGIVDFPVSGTWVMVFGSALYCAGSVVLVWGAPWVIGMNRKNLSDAWGGMAKTLRHAAE